MLTHSLTTRYSNLQPPHHLPLAYCLTTRHLPSRQSLNATLSPVPPTWHFNFHQTSIHKIMKIIKNVKNSNSVGWDNMPTNILKTNVMTLAPILLNLINKSLAQGLFPQSLKRAKILPIFRYLSYFLLMT